MPLLNRALRALVRVGLALTLLALPRVAFACDGPVVVCGTAAGSSLALIVGGQAPAVVVAPDADPAVRDAAQRSRRRPWPRGRHRAAGGRRRAGGSPHRDPDRGRRRGRPDRPARRRRQDRSRPSDRALGSVRPVRRRPAHARPRPRAGDRWQRPPRRRVRALRPVREDRRLAVVLVGRRPGRAPRRALPHRGCAQRRACGQVSRVLHQRRGPELRRLGQRRASAVSTHGPTSTCSSCCCG